MSRGEVDELYQATILDHDRAPRNHGPLAGATHVATVDNPLCGDIVTVELVVDGGAVHAAGFVGRGCSLSRAAGSMLTTQLAGLPLTEARAHLDRFEALVGSPPDAPTPDGLGELAAFAGVRRFRSRRACALLAARAVRAALGIT
jgi:nitrogen fixation NifU-like protein